MSENQTWPRKIWKKKKTKYPENNKYALIEI